MRRHDARRRPVRPERFRRSDDRTAVVSLSLPPEARGLAPERQAALQVYRVLNAAIKALPEGAGGQGLRCITFLLNLVAARIRQDAPDGVTADTCEKMLAVLIEAINDGWRIGAEGGEGEA